MLELYQDEDCPHSTAVREKLAELGVSYVIHNPRSVDGDVRNRTSYDRLLEEGGEDRIPYLVDTEAQRASSSRSASPHEDADREATLYESDEIVAHLEEYYG